MERGERRREKRKEVGEEVKKESGGELGEVRELKGLVKEEVLG